MNKNYIPLYRKYRPQAIEQIVGQEHIKKALANAIQMDRISHAYLFTGPRGTGKTSTARIFAKSLNCEKGPTISPCNECENCKNITNSIPIDVIEIDAASNRSVSDADEIIQKVALAPVQSRYKIYIIDEVHMLTNHAFNALLKTLEEPPENVIFILATTEVHKVLDTIKSRCQRFDFRRITTDDIVKHLRFISDKEKINISDDALFAIAKNSAGGMRDSISLLDQLSLLGVTKEITVEDVNAVLGRISFDILFKLTEQVIASNHAGAIELLNNIYNSGNEPLQILTNLSEYFKNLLIVKTCAKDLLVELTGLNEPQIKELSTQKEKLEVQQIVFLIERISYYIKEVKLATNQHLWLEVGMIDLANMSENSTLLDLQNRVKALEGGAVSIPAQPQVVVTRPAPIPPAAPKAEAEKPAQQQAAPAPQKVEETFTPPPISKKPDGNDIGSLWQCLLANIKSPSTQALLKLANPVQISADGVVITFKNERLVTQVNDTNKKKLIVDAANTMFNKNDINVTIRLAQSGDAKIEIKPQPAPAPAPVQQTAPQPQPKKEEPQQKTEEKKEEIKREETDQEKMVLDLFDGKYVE